MNTKKILHFSIGPIGAAVIGLITIPVMTWIFPPEDIGRLVMLQVTISFSLLLFSLGLDQAYVREYHEVDDKSSLLRAVILPGLAILSLVLIVSLFVPWSLSFLLFGIDSVFFTVLLLASVLLSFFSRFLSLILRMQERGLAFSISQVLPKALFLLIILGYLWWAVEADFKKLILANLLALLVVFILFAWNTRKDWVPALSSTIDRTKQKQMIRFGIPLIGGGMAFWGLTAMDKIFLRSLYSFEELGIYSVAISFAAAALVFQAIFSTIWVPIVYKWAAEGIDPQKTKNVIDYVTLAVLVIWSLAGMFSWVVTYILPPKYEQVQYILLAAMAYPLLYTLSEATGVGIGIKRKTIYAMLAAIVALSVNLVGNWWLIPIYGAGGAAISSAVAFFVFFVIRTEASSMVWVSFERWRMYILIIVFVIISVLINIIFVEKLKIMVFYFLMLLAAIFIYKKESIKVLMYLIVKVKPFKE